MVHSTCRAPATTAAKRVGHGQAEVVVAMHREDRLVGVGHAVEQLANGFRVLMRNGVAHGVREC